MFKNEYQGGPFVEIFSAQGKNPGTKWKIFGSPSVIGKEFDKEVKSFVFVLEGSSQTNKMQLPKEMRQTLGLIQQFLVLQIYVPLGQDFSTELLITDLGNIKRRLYLSTVHKELSVTPLHAKIPLFMIKRKTWCNLCVDLVAFTSEIFKGAVFQSLDGIIVSANCKLRKIFTLKSKPLDTADEVDGPTDAIPRACQLNSDVPQITQLLNMNKLRSSGQKCGNWPLTSPESGLSHSSHDHSMNRGSTTARSTKNQDVSHIAFGSKVLGPPPPSGRRFSTRASGEVTKSGNIRTNRSYQHSVLEKGRNPVQEIGRCEQSPSPYDEAVVQENKANICHTTQTSHDKDEWIFPNKESSQLDSGNQSLMSCETSCGFLTSALNVDQVDESKQTSEDWHEDIFTFSSKPRSAPHGNPLTPLSESCSCSVDLKEECSLNWRGAQMEDDFYGSESSKEDESYSEFLQDVPNIQTRHFISRSSEPVITKEIPLKMTSTSPEHWTNKGFSKHSNEENLPPRTEDLVVMTRKANNSQRSFSPPLCLCPTKNISGSCKESTGRSISSNPLIISISRKSLKEMPSDNSNPAVQNHVYDWRNYQPNSMSASELQMLASMKRQQNEELENSGLSHGLSASQIDNCNVSLSASSDDTTTWNSCLPAPINQGCHYQKEMNPLSHSNPRDWLNVFSPPIIPPSQQLAERAEMKAKLTPQGGGNFEVEEDELALLYDPCLSCYFDPESGKYYELA
ncbi:protein CFAP20DC isoform X2 [Eublepharis macularius]|uniref:Protein CFAP20DC isoform X2 n=1 Tax=Eublepharis macularius TaxID=481883 RepID=A0AA97J4Q4_EUBMA|nr:protein CFAP20DC isoform X2 [Eublepharis macularius]